VTDTGTGIPEAILHRIFEPFFTTKKVGKGTGLGLSISYGIVQDYDGTIKVKNKEGEGATFVIGFPRVREA
jgi:signal transduction histidine kinase